MSLSKPYSPKIEGVLHIGSMSRSMQQASYACPAYDFHRDIDKMIISGGADTYKPKLSDPTSDWQVLNFNVTHNSRVLAFDIAGSVLRVNTDNCVSVIRRHGKKPFTTLSEVLHIDTHEVYFQNMCARDCHPLRAGDIVVFNTGANQMFSVSHYTAVREPVAMKEGHELLVFLPKLKHVDLFEQNILGNPQVIKEIRMYIDGCVGCWDAVLDPANAITFEWVEARADSFFAQRFDRLQQLDSIYAGSTVGGEAEHGDGKRKKSHPKGDGGCA